MFILSQNLLSSHKKQTLKRSETHAPGVKIWPTESANRNVRAISGRK